eukprot:gene14998-21061_t
MAEPPQQTVTSTCLPPWLHHPSAIRRDSAIAAPLAPTPGSRVTSNCCPLWRPPSGTDASQRTVTEQLLPPMAQPLIQLTISIASGPTRSFSYTPSGYAVTQQLLGPAMAYTPRQP